MGRRRGGKAKGQAEKLPLDERLRRARSAADHLVDHVRSLFLMHEANQVVIYSPALASQVPRSFAAHAFNQFQRSMHLFEILRLTALWDDYRQDRESIPTIIDLIDHPDIKEQLIEDDRSHYAYQAQPYDLGRQKRTAEEAAVIDAYWADYRRREGDHEARKTGRRIEFAILKARRIMQSRRLQALQQFRHAYIAHNLAQLDPNQQTPGAPEALKVRYGDERFILRETVKVADALHLVLNGASFDWTDAQEMARDNARDLWDRCHFDFPAEERHSLSRPRRRREEN